MNIIAAWVLVMGLFVVSTNIGDLAKAVDKHAVQCGQEVNK